jgi:hypothetical protein
MFWAVQLTAEHDNLLVAWSWAIGTGNVGTAFKILAGFAPGEIKGQLPAHAARRNGPGRSVNPMRCQTTRSGRYHQETGRAVNHQQHTYTRAAEAQRTERPSRGALMDLLLLAR